MMVEMKVAWWAVTMAELMVGMLAGLKVDRTAGTMAGLTVHLMAEKTAVTMVGCWVGWWGSQTVGYLVDSMGHQRVENLVDVLADLWADKTAASLVVSSVVLKAD